MTPGSRRTRLLVSARDLAEAELCVAAGVDLLDLKEPLDGALGAVPAHVCREVVAKLGEQTPVSAALGELLDWDSTSEHVAPLPGLSFAKIGLAGCAKRNDWPVLWKRFADSLPAGTQSVAVAYADASRAGAPEVFEVIEATAPLGARVLLIDTFSKSHGGLLDFFSLADLRKIITAAQAISWQVVLGGSLRGDSIERALEIEPDVVAVRGAACEESRTGSLSKERICRLVKMVREQTFRDRAVRNA